MDIAYLFSSSLAPVQKQLISHLEPKDFPAMSLVSKAVRASLLAALASCVHNINGKLKKFFKNPLEFRRMQAETGTLIGGASALSFMGNAAASPDILDLFMAHDEDLRAMVPIVEYLEAEDEDWDQKDAKMNRDGGAEFRFQKSAGAVTVVMHSSPHGPLIPLLREATTTASLNFMTWNKAYSLFPRETLITKEAIVLQNPLDAKPSRTHALKASTVEDLTKKLDNVTMMEFLKLPEELRPVVYNDYIAGTASWQDVKSTLAKQQWRGDAVPVGWSWFDDLLVKQLNKFWDEEER
ncbi:hypothetical protein FB567DRAFT_545550 [Paraphoma chrysanthemicola]|uniref:Uncharacterized protein n=1 Tax=Paraphoma chrysanthemicola TaxID=798071 RepID=A0A8K0RGV5_9PLEO|nr:hypothetical protein FB567DRAFT_545550 [Paraphoma chrysanthemicola]